MGAAAPSTEALAHAWKRARLASGWSRQAHQALLTWDSSASDVCFQLLHVQVFSSCLPPPPPPGPRPRPPERCINMYASLGTVVDVAEVVVPVTVRAVKKGEMELIKGRMRSGADSK
jgi:hypothetical protein